MREIPYTEYRFEIKGVVKITVHGSHSEENCELATEKALEQVKKEIDADWVDDVNYEEYTDCEDVD